MIRTAPSPPESFIERVLRLLTEFDRKKIQPYVENVKKSENTIVTSPNS